MYSAIMLYLKYIILLMSRLNLNSIISWVDSHIIDYPTAINLNYNWSFGSSAGFCLVIQILSVAFLAMHYAGETHSNSLNNYA